VPTRKLSAIHFSHILARLRVTLCIFFQFSVLVVNIVVRSEMILLLTLINLLKPTGHVMHQQFNIQQLYVLPTLYLCVLCLSENKQRLVPLTS
jgi:hypothetical protein